MGGFDRFWTFLKRQRKKIVYTGAIVTAAYVAWKYAVSWLAEYKDRQMAVAFASARRQTHFESNQRTCNATVYSLMPSLRETVMDELNCEKLTEQLQLKPSNKVYIWSELKILSFTRALVTIYSTCILIVTLRVQLNMIGGCIYARSKQEIDLPLSDEESGVQQRYLESIQYFLSTGVRNLCSLVRHNVEKELINVSLKDTYTTDGLLGLIGAVRTSVERTMNGLKQTPFVDFIFPSPSGTPSKPDEGFSLAQLTRDTNDIMKDEDYHFVLEATIESGFGKLFSHLSKAHANIANEPRAALGRPLVGYEQSGVAFAKLIPPLVGTIHVTCSDTVTDYLQHLLTLPCIDDLAHQVYECFCESPATT